MILIHNSKVVDMELCKLIEILEDSNLYYKFTKSNSKNILEIVGPTEILNLEIV